MKPELPKAQILLWKPDVALILGLSIRTIDRMLSAGQLPPHDSYIRGRKVWKKATIHAWVNAKCPKPSQADAI